MKTATILILILITLPLALAQDAQISITPPSPVIYDVPFTAVISVNSHNVEFIDYDLSIGSSNNDVVFGTGLKRVDPFQVSSLTGSEQTYYRVRTETNGKVMQTNSLLPIFHLTKLSITGTSKVSTSLTLQFTPQRTITPATSGMSFANIQEVSSQTITPKLSSCGDGVVGYFDTNSNGVKDTGDANEACDCGTDPTAECLAGCYECRYIKLGYKGTDCHFGSRSCKVVEMDPGQFFLEKTTALINGECYPNAGHPEVLYCNNGQPILNYDSQGKINTPGKIMIVSSLAASLVDFFRSVVS